MLNQRSVAHTPYNTGSLCMSVANIILASKCIQAIGCLCFISTQKLSGIRLDKGVSVGYGHSMRLQEMAVRKNDEITCEGNSKRGKSVSNYCHKIRLVNDQHTLREIRLKIAFSSAHNAPFNIWFSRDEATFLNVSQSSSPNVTAMQTLGNCSLPFSNWKHAGE